MSYCRQGVYRVDRVGKRLKFLPFSSAGSGVIFPAAAFFRPLAAKGRQFLWKLEGLEAGLDRAWWAEGRRWRSLSATAAGRHRHHVDQNEYYNMTRTGNQSTYNTIVVYLGAAYTLHYRLNANDHGY